jgi:hypothetical protein
MTGSHSRTHGDRDCVHVEAKPDERPALPVELPALFGGENLRLVLKDGHTAHDI